MSDIDGTGSARRTRGSAFAIVVVTYVVAAAVGVAVAVALPGGHPLVRALIADVVATVVVFAASMVVDNASLYDPYWSVAPPVVVAGWLLVADDGVPARQALVAVLVVVWAVRLTANWASGWRGLSHEDWRYRQLREQTRGRVPWWLVNLVGIQLMPTLVVFAGLLAVWPAVAAGGRAVGPVDVLAAVVTATAIVVEAVADRQVRRFTADPANRGKVAEVGLWRWSRHPNYLGEIGFWVGMFLFGVAAAPDRWWTVLGPVAMVLLFATVSVPLMERRSLARRPAYADYVARVPALLPLPRRTARGAVDDPR